MRPALPSRRHPPRWSELSPTAPGLKDPQAVEYTPFPRRSRKRSIFSTDECPTGKSLSSLRRLSGLLCGQWASWRRRCLGLAGGEARKSLGGKGFLGRGDGLAEDLRTELVWCLWQCPWGCPWSAWFWRPAKCGDGQE